MPLLSTKTLLFHTALVKILPMQSKKSHPCYILCLVILSLCLTTAPAFAQLGLEQDTIESKRSRYGDDNIHDLWGIGLAIAGVGLVGLPLWIWEDLPPTLSHADFLFDLAIVSPGSEVRVQPTFSTGRFFSHQEKLGIETLLRAQISSFNGLEFSEVSYRMHLRFVSMYDAAFNIGVSTGPGLFYDGTPALSMPTTIRINASNLEVGLVVEHTQFLTLHRSNQEQTSMALFPKRLFRKQNISIGLAYHLYTQAFRNPAHGIAIELRVL